MMDANQNGREDVKLGAPADSLVAKCDRHGAPAEELDTLVVK